MKTVLLLLCLFVACPGFSQTSDALKTKYENETLHFYKGYISKGLNGERIRYRDLASEFSISPEAANEFAIYKRKRTSSLIMTLGSASLVIAGVIVADGGNKNLGKGLAVSGLVINLVALPIAISGGKKLQHAIWLRNRDLLFSAK